MMADKKRAVTAILGPESPNVGIKGEEDEGPEALHALGEELIECFHSKDAAGAIDCLRTIFEEFENSHEQGSHAEGER